MTAGSDRPSGQPGKVAILRASRIGDFLLATPTLRALRRAWPEAEIVFIGLPRVETLARRCRHVDRFEPFPGFPGIADQFYDPRRTLGFLARMQAERFDLAVQLHGSGAYSNIFTSLLGAREMVGRSGSGETTLWMNRALRYTEEGHEIHRALALATFLGASAQGDYMEFPLSDEDDQELEALPEMATIGSSHSFAVLHPGAEVEAKRWPAERFADVGRGLLAMGFSPLAVTGLAGEKTLTAQVARTIGPAAMDLGGQLSLGGLGALLWRATLLVTNDTATAHIAYALGTPSVTIFGPQDPARWGPLDHQRHAVIFNNVECRPCDHEICPMDHRCLAGVSADDVLLAATQVIRPRFV